MNVRETASRANTLGLCVVPVREDGSKAPDVGLWTELQRRRPTDSELKRWFPKEPERAGLGFICGAVSGGLELFEFDDPAAIIAFKQLADAAGLGSLWRRLEMGYSEETPGGGCHWLYKVPEPLGNTKLASKPCEGCSKHQVGQAHVLVESRGEGGFVVVAPSGGSTHPSGRPYVLRAGGLETIPILTVEERDELWALARSLDEMPRPEPIPDVRGDRATDGTRPGDVYSAQASWSDVLEPHGWKHVHRRGGEDYWRRPGKGQGISATTNYHDSDLLYVFSTS
ncbi:MAG: bifunctional DNA primase/polymerase, partial [Gemmatimonadaceae bacterium]|nr:bifunctional DNA primase/polymerase [Gemmatimonadaceae bacterium]